MKSKATLIALVAAAQCSCTMKQVELDLSEYPKLPTARMSKVLRTVVSSNNYMRKRALWGNYGGPGCEGGVPVDTLDRYFLQHDLAYLQGVTREELEAADRTLISQLEALEGTGISPEADTFRLGAIKYFNKPISRVVGKPPDVVFGWKKAPTVIDISHRGSNTK